MRSFVSERVASLPTSGIRVIFDRAMRMTGVIRMEAGEPDFSTPGYIAQAAEKAIEEGFTHYTSSAGIPELLRAISAALRTDNSIEADPESELLVTPGAGAAVYLSAMCTVDPGDEVLVPDPAWPHYDAVVRLAGGRVVRYRAGEETGFRPDFDQLTKLVTSKTKAIFVNSPSNPTGCLLSRGDLEKIADLALANDLLVISDEIYQKIIYDGTAHYSIASFKGMKDRTITIGGFSKTFAMTGWRVGFAAGNAEVIAQMNKLNLFSAACANSIAQRAAIAALAGDNKAVEYMREQYRKRRDLIVGRLNEIEGFSCHSPGGAFYVFPRVEMDGMSASKVAMFLLENAKVATVPGTAFGGQGENHLRLSYATSVEKITEAMDRIAHTVKTLKPITDSRRPRTA